LKSRRPSLDTTAPGYLYGLVPNGVQAPSATGIDGRQVEVWKLDEHLAVLRSCIDNPPVLPRRANLAAHHRVLAEAMAATGVLPMRFGFVSNEDPSVVLKGLDRVAARNRLTEFEGKIEVQLLWDSEESQALQRAAHRRPAIRECRLGKADRGRMVLETLTELAFADITAAVNQLGAFICRTGETEASGYSARIALLVKREDFEPLQRRCELLAQQAAALGSLRTVGALPPYSFVDLALEVPGS
jgi:hypothetical protein